MKLTSFIKGNTESWGVVINHPVTGSAWIFNPGRLERFIRMRAGNQYGSLALRMPELLGGHPWPEDIVLFLDMEERGMTALCELITLAESIWKTEDQALLELAGCPLEHVWLCAPVPQPRLVFGLVSNSPYPFRNEPKRRIINLIPQGHQRPRTSIIGPNEPIVIPDDARKSGYNVELGVVIGKKGKNISIGNAMKFVVGYTCINDIYVDSIFRKYIGDDWDSRYISELDWFCDASASWGGKMTDTCCAMGPYLVTCDEVGDPNDLLVYSRQSGRLRDRGHTGAMLLGIGKLIAWYSSFATLYPGDIIHMGTMAYDGLPLLPEMKMGPNEYVEVEIEKIGIQRNPLVRMGQWDWRDDNDDSKRIHASPAVRSFIRHKYSAIELNDWSPTIRHIPDFWIIYGNYKQAPELENLKIQKFPRFLNAPNTGIGRSGDPYTVPKDVSALSIGIELSFVVKQVAQKVKRSQADQYILGYLPMVSLGNFGPQGNVVEPATRQEQSVPIVYSRWFDGCNIVSDKPVYCAMENVRSLSMSLQLEGADILQADTENYVSDAAEILAFITSHITLLPGDVITLGRVGEVIEIPQSDVKNGMLVKGAIEGIGTVEISIVRTDKE